MNRLQAQFGDDIQFILLDIDDRDSLPLRQQYGVVQRTSYVLVAPSGEPVLRWFGPLSGTTIDEDIAAWLASQ